jgi:periplasmic protein TonB
LSVFVLLSVMLHAGLFSLGRMAMVQPSIMPLEELEPIFIDLIAPELPEPESVAEPMEHETITALNPEPEIEPVVEDMLETPPEPEPEPEMDPDPPPEEVEEFVIKPERVEEELIEVAQVITEEVITQPAIIRNPPPPYPQEARRRGWEGVVSLRVGITREGRVADVAISQSSGHAVLDESARRTVQRWRFTPARRLGVPVATTIALPVRFELSAAK